MILNHIKEIQMRTAIVRMFKERPNGDLNEFIIELIIPSRRRYGAVIKYFCIKKVMIV